MPKRRVSNIVVDGAIARVELTQGQWAVIDSRDVPLVKGHAWYADKKGHSWYASTKSDGLHVQMHRVIANTPKGLSTDHIDHDGLNNRRRNLRVCTHAENMANRRPRPPRPPRPTDPVKLARYIRWRLNREVADPFAEIVVCSSACGPDDMHPCAACLTLPASTERTKEDVADYVDRVRAEQRRDRWSEEAA